MEDEEEENTIVKDFHTYAIRKLKKNDSLSSKFFLKMVPWVLFIQMFFFMKIIYCLSIFKCHLPSNYFLGIDNLFNRPRQGHIDKKFSSFILHVLWAPSSILLFHLCIDVSLQIHVPLSFVFGLNGTSHLILSIYLISWWMRNTSTIIVSFSFQSHF